MSRIELLADLNARDNDGHGWSILADATDPASVQPGTIVLAGDRDGQIHFETR